MDHLINAFLFIIIGSISGLFYFGGLWLTLQYMNRARFSVLIILISYVLRTAIILLVLFYITRSGQWVSILFWLAGFIIARIFLSRFLGRDSSEKTDKE